MLIGINPLLTGQLLDLLDRMGHGDAIVITDAHYPAYRSGAPVVVTQASTPGVLTAIRTVIPVDSYDDPPVALMRGEAGIDLSVQDELRAAAQCDSERITELERFDFYAAAASAFAVVRTGDTRPYANVLLRKGVILDPTGGTA